MANFFDTDGEDKRSQYINWMSVDSSCVRSARWEADTMYVEFTNGYDYAYPGVPIDVFEEFLSSGSKGRFLNAVIKPNYG